MRRGLNPKKPWRHPAVILTAGAVSLIALSRVGTPRPSARTRRRSKLPTPDANGVHLYGAQWCPACMSLKSELDARGIPFRYHDIETEPQADAFVMSQSDDGVIPVTTVDGEVFLGYQPDAIQTAYARRFA